jgi:hypothetical protein
LIKRYTLDLQALPSTDVTDTFHNLVHHVVVLTVQTTDALSSRAGDVEDAGGIVAVVDGDFVSVGHRRSFADVLCEFGEVHNQNSASMSWGSSSTGHCSSSRFSSSSS